jgi:SAM-dependent methyltransferase
MQRAGLRVTAMDASAQMVALARRHPGITVRRASFDDIAGTAIYDGIWCNFALLHAPRADFPRHLAALRRAVRPGALVFISMKLGTGEGYDAIGRFYCYHSAEALERQVAKAGFAVVSRHFGADTGLAGTVDDWIGLFARAGRAPGT